MCIINNYVKRKEWISIYHGQEKTKLWIHVNIVSVSEDELRLSLLLTSQDNGNLLGSHRQHRQLNTVELVKTSPGARLSKT